MEIVIALYTVYLIILGIECASLNNETIVSYSSLLNAANLKV